MPFKERLKVLSLLVGGILFIVFCFVFPLVVGTIIGLGVVGLVIRHGWKQGKEAENSDENGL